MKPVDPTNLSIEFVPILSTWVERNGVVWYLWKVEGEKEWHEKETAQKEIPYHIKEYVHPLKYQQMLEAAKSTN